MGIYGAQTLETPIYIVYSFEKDRKSSKSQPSWIRHEATQDANKATHLARELFNTNHFEKIEIKKQFFDSKISRTVDCTYKIFQNSKISALIERIKKVGLSSALVVIAFSIDQLFIRNA